MDAASESPADGGAPDAAPRARGAVIAEPEDAARVVFDQDTLRTYNLVVDPADLAVIDAQPSAEVYVNGSMEVDGQTYGPLSIRYKGSPGGFLPPCTETGAGQSAGPKTGKCSMNQMYRAFSMSDPVPMVPIAPFLHGPGAYPGALCGSRHGIVNPFAHMMSAYKAGFTADTTWRNLTNAAHVTPMNIEELLQLASQQVNMAGVSGGLYLLGRILKKLLSASNNVIGSQVTGAVTALDQIGLTLTRARRSSPEIDEQLGRFMKYALILAGLPFKIGAVISAAYLTHVLTILLRTVVGQATPRSAGEITTHERRWNPANCLRSSRLASLAR